MEELPNLLSADVVSQIGDIGFEGAVERGGQVSVHDERAAEIASPDCRNC